MLPVYKWKSKGCIPVLLYLCVHTLFSDGKVDESKCKKLFTYGYGYRQFFHVSQSSVHQVSEGAVLNMRFWVKARSNAHVLLSTSPSPEETDPVYELVLGAGKNTFSDIRRRHRAATKSSAYTSDILSGTELKGFWVCDSLYPHFKTYLRLDQSTIWIKWRWLINNKLSCSIRHLIKAQIILLSIILLIK